MIAKYYGRKNHEELELYYDGTKQRQIATISEVYCLADSFDGRRLTS